MAGNEEICLMLISLTSAILIVTTMATSAEVIKATIQTTLNEIDYQKDQERKEGAIGISINQSNTVEISVNQSEAAEISVNCSGCYESELPLDVSYEIQWITQYVDHFNMARKGPTANRDTFKQRFLISAQYWCGGGCPILFYCGSAGDIEHLAHITGWMWQNAAHLRAMLVFVEHRYYGSSLVYPINLTNINEPKELAKLNYLSGDQALEDYHILISEIKTNLFDARSSPVITVGGSYGAMLAAWMRIKYPNLIDGALAASAPILVGSRDYDNNSYYKIITKSYESYSKRCAQSIRLSWRALRNHERYGDDGLKELGSIFKLCKPLKNVNNLILYLKKVWILLAHRDHAHTSIFNKALPAYPVERVCSILDEDTTHIRDEQLILNIARASQIYNNNTGQIACLDLNDGIKTHNNNDTNSIFWSYQVCTEFDRPIYSDGENDMFELELSSFEDYCQDRWGTENRVVEVNETTVHNDTGGLNKTNLNYERIGRNNKTSPHDDKKGLNRTATHNKKANQKKKILYNYKRNVNKTTLYNDKDSLNMASKIIFSFGSRDPWSAGCPQRGNEEKAIHVIRMDGVCDYEDLFASWKNDSTEVKEARKKELRIINDWIRNYY